MLQLNLQTVATRIQQEIEARALQGFETNGLPAQWEKSQTDRAALMSLHKCMKTLPLQQDWPYNEPSMLPKIQQARPAPISLPDFYLAEAEIRHKIHGAWLGRVAGCILGKPLEVHFDMAQIRDYLEQAHAYPLTDFVPAQSSGGSEPLRRDCVPSMRGYVQYAQEDDDINYMCLAVKLVERYGADFNSLAVGTNWLRSIPFGWTWGPEHAVYLNLAAALGDRGYDYEPDLPDDIDLEAVTDYLNPGIEWIGAQIRTDVYGYICPGNPELAADFAWRDAYLSHRRSGIYGAMWVAAMNAAAFTLLDMEAVIHAGLAQVPQNSRFTEAVLQTIEWVHTDADWEKTGQRIEATYDKYSFAGTINNACCVTAALLYGWEDGLDSPAEIYERTIVTAVQLAYDTDCNAATAGSIAGLMLGASALPSKWIAPLNDTLHTCVAEFGQVSISDMAERTYQLSRLMRQSNSWR